VDIKLADCQKRAMIDVKRGGVMERQFLFLGKENIKGTVDVRPNKKFEHMGAKIELIGCIGSLHFLCFFVSLIPTLRTGIR
jgi:hypothetical protein